MIPLGKFNSRLPYDIPLENSVCACVYIINRIPCRIFTYIYFSLNLYAKGLPDSFYLLM